MRAARRQETHRPMSRFLFTNGLIFDGRSPDLLADHDVVVEDGIIAQISPTASGPFDSIVDLKGATLMPGLIDAHFHAYAVEEGYIEGPRLFYCGRAFSQTVVAHARGEPVGSVRRNAVSAQAFLDPAVGKHAGPHVWLVLNRRRLCISPISHYWNVPWRAS
jgi:hypothetical protein